MERLNDKIVLITGSSTGVGEGIARRATAEGATVVLHGRDEEREQGERLAAELRTVFLVGDLALVETPGLLIKATIDRFGRLDGMVNNAAVSWRGGIEATSDFYDRIMAINARAPFLLVQAARPYLRRAGIVNIGSVNARKGGADMLPYAMSKAALAAMTRTLAAPLANDRVRINALNLGWTLTPNERTLLSNTFGWAEDWPETLSEGAIPLGRMLSPTDVAAMVVYLLSEEAEMITGQVWDFDQRSHGG